MSSSKKYLQTLSSKPPSSVFRTPKIQLFLKTEFNKLPLSLYHVKCSTAKTFAPCWTNLHLSLISPQTLSSKNKNIQVSKLPPQNSNAVHQSSNPRYHLRTEENNTMVVSQSFPPQNRPNAQKIKSVEPFADFWANTPSREARARQQRGYCKSWIKYLLLELALPWLPEFQLVWLKDSRTIALSLKLRLKLEG